MVHSQSMGYRRHDFRIRPRTYNRYGSKPAKFQPEDRNLDDQGGG